MPLSKLTWADPPESLVLLKNEVHVWATALDLPQYEIDPLWQTLSPDEQQRAARMDCIVNRNRFIVARGILRGILSKYVAVDPAHLHFGYGPQGKPSIAYPNKQEEICFNLSHSLDLAVYAVVHQRPIGIDVEYIRHNINHLGVAQSRFSAQEYKELCTLPEVHQHEAFFTCWTRKEAYVKALGVGLDYPLDRFIVSLNSNKTVTFLQSTHHVDADSQWSLYHLRPVPGSVGAIAIEGHDLHIRYWRYTAK